MTKEDTATLPVIQANWGVPPSIVALTTTRIGGISKPPFDQLNLASHVDDSPKAVSHNRKLIERSLRLPSAPVWLNQVHGARVAEVARETAGTEPTVDAAITRESDCVLAIMTADCLPIVLSAPEHRVIAAIHAGWRGLADNIIQNTIVAMDCPPSAIHAWLGPAIGPNCFEVGVDVWHRFVDDDEHMAPCFKATENQKFMADIYQIARRTLNSLGVIQVSGGEHCTYTDVERFYSYRKNPQTGRMATLIWMSK